MSGDNENKRLSNKNVTQNNCKIKIQKKEKTNSGATLNAR